MFDSKNFLLKNYKLFILNLYILPIQLIFASNSLDLEKDWIDLGEQDNNSKSYSYNNYNGTNIDEDLEVLDIDFQSADPSIYLSFSQFSYNPGTGHLAPYNNKEIKNKKISIVVYKNQPQQEATQLADAVQLARAMHLQNPDMYDHFIFIKFKNRNELSSIILDLIGDPKKQNRISIFTNGTDKEVAKTLEVKIGVSPLIDYITNNQTKLALINLKESQNIAQAIYNDPTGFVEDNVINRMNYYFPSFKDTVKNYTPDIIISATSKLIEKYTENILHYSVNIPNTEAYYIVKNIVEEGENEKINADFINEFNQTDLKCIYQILQVQENFKKEQKEREKQGQFLQHHQILFDREDAVITSLYGYGGLLMSPKSCLDARHRLLAAFYPYINSIRSQAWKYIVKQDNKYHFISQNLQPYIQEIKSTLSPKTTPTKAKPTAPSSHTYQNYYNTAKSYYNTAWNLLGYK